MRRLFGTLAIVLLSVGVAIAQGRDDHNDRAPLKSGYAVITPTGGAGLVVFETFGWRRGGDAGTPQAGLLAPDLTTNAVLYVDRKVKLSKNLGVAIVNPNTSNTNVSLTVRGSDGKKLGTKTVNVPSHQQIVSFFTELYADQPSVPRDVTGTVAITSAGSSNLPVSVIGLRFRGANFSTEPVTNLSGNVGPLPPIGNGGGPGAVLLPQFVVGGGWATEIVMVNTGTVNLTVRVDLFNGNGSPLSATLNGQTASSFTNLSIPAGGVLTLAPRDQNGDDDF